MSSATLPAFKCCTCIKYIMCLLHLILELIFISREKTTTKNKKEIKSFFSSDFVTCNQQTL